MLAYRLNSLKAKVREKFGSLLKVHIQGQAEVSTKGRVAVVRRGRGRAGVGRHLTGRPWVPDSVVVLLQFCPYCVTLARWLNLFSHCSFWAVILLNKRLPFTGETNFGHIPTSSLTKSGRQGDTESEQEARGETGLVTLALMLLSWSRSATPSCVCCGLPERMEVQD